ncbi:hypothetical protein ACP4OV_028171 [Aristida adscensionis]
MALAVVPSGRLAAWRLLPGPGGAAAACSEWRQRAARPAATLVVVPAVAGRCGGAAVQRGTTSGGSQSCIGGGAATWRAVANGGSACRRRLPLHLRRSGRLPWRGAVCGDGLRAQLLEGGMAAATVSDGGGPHGYSCGRRWLRLGSKCGDIGGGSWSPVRARV